MEAKENELNLCKCGSKKYPDIDSDDMIPCWMVKCYDCNQSRHGASWTRQEAVIEWNKFNKPEPKR